MRTLDVVVRVPSGRINLHAPDTFLDQATSQQATPAEVSCQRVVHAVHILCLLSFLAQVEDLGNLHLHAECQLIVLDPCFQFVVIGMLCCVFLIQLSQQIEIAPLSIPSDACRREQVENWRSSRSQSGPLEVRRQEAVGPVGSAALRVSDLGQNDESGQVLILGTKSIRDPGTNRRITTKPVARIHVVIRGRMIDRLAPTTVIDAQLIRDTWQMLEVLTHGNAGLARLAKLERTLHEIPLPGSHGRGELVLSHKLLEVQIVELRLLIKRVDMTWSSSHKQLDTGFGFAWYLLRLRSQRASARITRQQISQRNSAERTTQPIQKAAPLDRGCVVHTCVL